MKTARDALRAIIPDALESFEAAGSLSLAGHAMSFAAPHSARPALQDGGDLIDLACSEATGLFSPRLAKALRLELEENFHALTANHHGVDFHPEFMQGTLLFAMNCRHAVPLFSCGGVPGNNVAYPRGILMGRGEPGSFRPTRLPVLPDKNRHILVSAQAAFDEAPVRTALAALPAKRLPALEEKAAARIMRNIYLHPRVLAQSCFRNQASIMNGLLWEHIAAPECGLPPLAALDMQYLSGRLIARDAALPHTLIHRLLMEPSLTAAVWEELDGQRACWERDGMGRIQRGTFLFWGVDEKGRALALAPSPDFRELVAVRRPEWRVALEPDALRGGLEHLRLLPSLFLFFVAVSVARGLRCAGGVFQCGYLPRMGAGVAAALRRCGESAVADRIHVSSPPCTGLVPLRLPRPDGITPEEKAAGHAAGALELATCGGLSTQLWEAIRAARVGDALAVSLPYHYEDLAGENRQEAIWRVLMREAASVRSLPFLRGAAPAESRGGAHA